MELAQTTRRIAAEALEFAKAHLTNRDAVVDKRAIEQFALEHAMGKIDLGGLRRQMARQQAEGKLVPDQRLSPHRPRGAFTTLEMLELDSENVALMRTRLNDAAEPIASRSEVERWGIGKGLSPEQINAAQLALGSKYGIAAIEGFAGAAKTTTVGAIKEFAQEHGYTVRGCGTTSGSVQALRDASITARTLASLHASALPAPHGPEPWFVDESSLIASREINETLKVAREFGIERLILVGDQGQHQAIEAGAPMRQFLREGMPMAALQDIRRQQDPELRQAVRTAHDDGAGALDLLSEQGRVFEVPDAHHRYQRIAIDYVRGYEAGQNTLVVSPGNDERRALNAEIREVLVNGGHVARHGRAHAILVRRDLTPEQVKNANSYQPGDIVHCSGNQAQQRQGIRKNSYLTVVAVERNAELLTLRDEKGRSLQVSPLKWKQGRQIAAEVYSQESRTLEVGDRLQLRAPDNRARHRQRPVCDDLRANSHRAKLRFEDRGRQITLPYRDLQHVDYGYTVTSFSSQGSTVDRVIVNDDSMRSARLVNRKQEYVSISRAD